MRCFTHRDSDAIGLCKHCSRAICDACARINEFGIACSEICEKHLSEYDQMTERSLEMYRIGGRKRVPASSLLALFLGLGFTITGLPILWTEGLGAGGFLGVIGAFYTIYAIYMLFIDKKTPRY